MKHNTALKFREIRRSDCEIMKKLMRAGKGYWGYPEEGLDRFMANFGGRDNAYFQNALGFIAEEKDTVIGYYAFTTGNEPMLDDFFLDTRFIGQGYGRKLWEHCIEQAKAKGWESFSFWSDPNSQPFYEHMGATKIDERPMVTMPGLMAPIMRYDLV